MKTTKILQTLFFTSLTFLFFSCGSSSQQTPIWEGRVQPGTYSGRYSNYNGVCHLNYRLTVTISDNEEVEVRESISSPDCFGGTETKVYYGYIHRYEEMYNGTSKVWFGVNARTEGGSVYETSFNLSTNMEYSPGDCETYQEYSMRDKECTLR